MTINMQKPDLTPDQRNRIFQRLVLSQQDGKLQKGLKGVLAAEYGVTIRTINTLWKSAQEKMIRDQAVVFKSNKKGKSHLKARKVFDEDHFRKMLPPHKKSSRKIGKQLGVSHTTVLNWKKNGTIKAHTNHVKPKLTDKNKLQRMQFCLSQIWYDPDTKTFKFHDMYNVIHVDEKWFYMEEPIERYYVLPNEIPEIRPCQSKRFIQKVMFLCATGRPHQLPPQVVEFDGKIGCWPLTHIVPAKRKSVNRPKGTPEIKPITSIDKEVTKDFMLTKVIPAIKSKWPINASKRILIQWDNATPHISNDDPDIRAACSSDGFDIQLFFQPANSPDLNINDLGWFRCLQTVQWETRTYTVENLCEVVADSFEQVDSMKLNKIFLSLQQGMIEILKHKGCNGFKQPHMGKDALIRRGELPEVLEVDEDLLRDSIEHVLEGWDGEVPNYDFSDLMESLGYGDEP